MWLVLLLISVYCFSFWKVVVWYRLISVVVVSGGGVMCWCVVVSVRNSMVVFSR